MKLVFAENAWEDCLYWQRTDEKTLNTFALLAILREGNASASPDALGTATEAIEHIGTTLDRQLLE